MPLSHIGYNPGTQAGSRLRAHTQQLENGRDGLIKELATMTLMIDGDGSDAAHFTYMATEYGFDSTAHAKACWDELNSMLAKLTTDGNVTNVKAAFDQYCNKVR